jgi:integrase
MKVKYKVVFNRRKRLNKDGTAPVEISCYLKENPSNTKRYYHTTGIYILPKQWSKAHLEINKHHANNELLNERIKNIVWELEKFELSKTKSEGGYFQLDLFRQFKDDKKPLFSLIDFINDDIENNKKVSAATIKQYKNLLNILQLFKPGDIKLKEVNLSFVNKFDQFLYSKNYAINTVWKFHKNLKRFLNLAIDMDQYPKEMYPYDKFKLKKEQTERVFLTETELKEFESINIDKDHPLYLIKQVFLFECYTSIRYSDIRGLKRKDFDVNGEEFIIKLKALKTGKFDRIPLNKLFNGKPVDILKSFWREDNKPFFGDYSLQHINRELKKLDKYHNINKNITTHAGRHTFGTTLAKKVPLPILKKLMQHSNIDTTLIYTHITNEATKKALDNIEWD